MSKVSRSTTQVRPVGMGGGRMGGAGYTGEKAQNFSATLKTFAGYMRHYWLTIVVVTILAIASTIFTVVGPKLLGDMTNQVVNGYTDSRIYKQVVLSLPKGVNIPANVSGTQLLNILPRGEVLKLPASEVTVIKNLKPSSHHGINFTKIGQVAMLLVFLYLLSALFNFTQGYVMSGVTQRITYKFRKDISAKINLLPLSYFDSRSYGEVLTHVTNDVDSISQSLNQTLTQIITSATTLIGITIMMFTISWKLTLVALITLPLSFGAVGIIISKSQKYFKNQQDTLGNVNAKVEETYGAQLVVTAYNGQQRAYDEFQTMNRRLYNNAWKAQFLSGLTNPLTTFISNIGYVGVAVVGGILALQGSVSIGSIQAFLQYIRNFSQPISQVANVANIIQQMAAAAERVFTFLDQPEESVEKDNSITLSKVSGGVEFNNVLFGYLPDRKVIKNFSAKIEPGQRIAIVGPTGAGKTTIVNLLMRFYELNAGSIKVDGVDIASMKRADVRKMFGMVLQDAWLFNSTIRDNIAYATTQVDDEKVEQVSKDAHLDHFIRSLPNGYDTILDEEADNVSQGEKQLLTIARAMLEDAPMMILDEATSSVDTRTEALIQQAIDHIMIGKTSFVIAHRLSTIKNADLILVMNEGNIVEQGKHEDLLSKNGFYAKMYNSQFSPTSVEI